MLMQLNARVLLTEITARMQKDGIQRKATLDDFPDNELDAIAQLGFDIIYMLGVWSTGEYGMLKSKKLLETDPCMMGFPEEAACSSPFAITDYSVHSDFGGDEALGRLYARVRQRKMRLILDFVPNHMAVDHPWVTQHPEYFICSKGEHEKEPQNYFKAGKKTIAYGRGEHWEAWEDTAQINYGHKGLREEMLRTLRKIASLSDGVRCDVAMLVEQDLLKKAWGQLLKPADGSPECETEFWPTAVQETKAENPHFIFMAESYWDREKSLQDKGFDFCYDKVLYDRLVEGDGPAVVEHLKLDPSYLSKLAHFVENHDEERAATVWSNSDQHMAAAVITFTVPGLRFFHDGEQLGRTRRVSMHVNCRVPESEDVKDATLRKRYLAMLLSLQGAALRDGEWELCDVSAGAEASEGVPAGVVAHCCWSPTEGGGVFTEVVLTIVNYQPKPCNARISLMPGGKCGKALTGLLHGRMFTLKDRLSRQAVATDGGLLLGEKPGGLQLSLQPWEARVFDLTEQ